MKIGMAPIASPVGLPDLFPVLARSLLRDELQWMTAALYRLAGSYRRVRWVTLTNQEQPCFSNFSRSNKSS